MMKVLVTGGSGFIGSAIVRQLLLERDAEVVNVDKLTYAADQNRLQIVSTHPSYVFVKADVCDVAKLTNILEKHQPDAIIHCAAETHVDRSIDSSDAFIKTNILGTHKLLEASRSYLSGTNTRKRSKFRYLQVSTDEVYGDRCGKSSACEDTAYKPSSPYAASKAAADHLVDAWIRTYNFPALVTHSSNNYGPGQHPEKLIPKVITKAMRGQSIPVYGSGKQVRDWLHVDDNANGVISILQNGKLGEHYNLSGDCERTNLDIIESICGVLAGISLSGAQTSKRYHALIDYVTDRLGHDARYSIKSEKAKKLGWQPKIALRQGLEKTVKSYMSL